MQRETKNIKNFSSVSFNKNIVEEYLKGGLVSLSSKNKEFFKKEKVVVDSSPYNKKKLNLQVKTSIAEITITKEMVVVDNLKEVNMFLWFREFEKIGDKNGWTAHQRCELLEHVIVDSSLDLELHAENYDENKCNILLYTYPVGGLSGIINSLDNVKQVNFKTIKEYYNSITHLVEMYSLHNHCSRIEYTRKVDEVFKKGLGMFTKDYLIKSGLEKVEIIMKNLINMEDKLDAELSSHNPKDIQVHTDSSKWCSFHKSRTHDSSNCRNLQRKRDSSNGDKKFSNNGENNVSKYKEKDQTMVICENRILRKIPELKININGTNDIRQPLTLVRQGVLCQGI